MSQPIRTFATIGLFEYRLCVFIHRAGRWPMVRYPFQAISRLGNGPIWYAFLLGLPILAGRTGLEAALVMALGAVAGLGIYKGLKVALVRERPYISHADINCLTAPLDRYSFPSGHTLHAVFFAVMGSAWFPILAPALFVFAGLIALSRPLLGLHYPTDVLVGALIGWSLAEVMLLLFPPGALG
ncbi:phosphatase PAP2 family protein [Wenzhouxiangella limi]|uniref:undecaprenyl-diphosphate phosphatase n=1 Tax=Wenzhouxiangella limi TaxID=2707351 RepID=A0A845V1Q8_9GAMM|nr:phosphatase PAP2 family protein [Wenzhouxiangella limi]NDY95196.1 phosphatase PAP2 family protein [Wenzhouxiangella limi]